MQFKKKSTKSWNFKFHWFQMVEILKITPNVCRNPVYFDKSHHFNEILHISTMGLVNIVTFLFSIEHYNRKYFNLLNLQSYIFA